VLAHVLRYYASTRYYRRDFAAAEAALREAEAIADVSSATRLQLLELRAQLSMDTGDLDAAARSFARLRDHDRSLGNRRNEAISATGLAEVEFRRERYERAADLWREAAAVMRGENEPATLTEWLVRLGSTLGMSGDLEAATAAALEALVVLARQEPEHVYVTQAIELLAYIAAMQSDVERSARLAGYTDPGLARLGAQREYVPQTIRERLMARLETQLTPDALARLTADGAALTPEAAIVLARKPGTPTSVT